ncbi:MAG: HAD-IIB family hydrolase [Pseudomonadota bacterium]
MIAAQPNRQASRMPEPDLILATDLDGTFLGGSERDRADLYGWIEEHRAQIGLIFVTGRDLPFIEGLCADGFVPWPDHVVGDVGTTIASVDRAKRAIRPNPALEHDIRALWGERFAEIKERLETAPGLSPQTGPFRYRMSYHYDPRDFDPEIVSVVEGAGFDCLISDDRFLDVLPKGVSKGPSLLRLLDAIEADHDRVLVAGDTMNDLSLFETGLLGVAVGNSEPPLVERVQGRLNVHHASGHGAAGIREAIDRFGFFDPERLRLARMMEGSDEE